MARGAPLTTDEQARIRELAADGKSRNAIARDLHRSPSVVGRYAETAGITWDRSATEVATRAKQADNAARRAATIPRLYDQVDLVLARLEAPTYKATAEWGGRVKVTEVARDAIPPGDVRSLATTASNLLQTAAKLEAVDVGRTDRPARSMLAELGADISRLAADLDGVPDDEAA